MVPVSWAGVASVMLLCISGVLSKRSGAPDTADVCRTMRPGHTAAPQVIPPPFEILINRDSYTAGDTLQVQIKATGDWRFKGFLIQARRADPTKNQVDAIGFFGQVPGTATICSGKSGNALTHRGGSPGSDDDKESLTLTWTATNPTQGHIEFRVTIVSDYDHYWVMEPSRVIRDLYKKPMPTTPPAEWDATVQTKPITTDGCGKTKGCYSNPSGCKEANCEVLVTWKDIGDWVEFEMSADSDGWVAVGLSHDKKMGEDDVVECTWNERDDGRSVVEVWKSWNGKNQKSNKLLDDRSLGLKNAQGSKSDGRIRCTFSRQKTVPGRPEVFDLTSRYHILLAKGKTTSNGVKEMHAYEAGKHPYVSKVKVSMQDKVSIDGTARYPLVKIHAILMLVGWMVCACIAVLLAKYYKFMWPNKKMCGERPWFAFHRALQVINLICTVLAFILIFIHAGGYSKLPNLPAKAHPILGIITTVLCILNPLIALCRPNPKHNYRPVFNWIHWFIGIIAMVLSVPTLFIGLNLPKAHVPWWATWVMVAFFLFHFIIELMLEIHGCLNSRKQKERNKEFDMRKKAPTDGRGDYYGLEPEPVGTRFKKTILSLYLFVCIVLAIVMIITIAIS